MTFNLPWAAAGDPASQTAAMTATIVIARRMCCLLERMCAMGTDRELELEQELVGDLIAGVDRPPVLAAQLTEFARPERERRRRASIVQREIRGAVRGVIAAAGKPAARELIVA